MSTVLGLGGRQGLADLAINSGVKTQIQINFAAPGALNTDTVGSDVDTGVTQFTPLQNNVITDVQHDVNPVAGLLFTLFVRRLNFVRAALGRTANFSTLFDGIIRPGFPRTLRAGFLNFVETQQAGALTTQNYIITTIQPLVT